MVTTRLVLSAGQTVVRLAGVVKRHVVTYKTLDDIAISIASKSIHSCAAAKELCNLIEAPDVRSFLFAHALKDLNEIQQNLSSVITVIESSTPMGRFLPVPVLSESLKEIESKLSQLENYYHKIGIKGSMISLLQTGTRAFVLSALTSSESMIVSSDHIQQFFHDVESQARALTVTRNGSPIKGEARIAFAMGLTIYGDRIGKPNSAFKQLHPEELHSAARFFRKACRLGVKEAYRHLGDLYYEGHGVEICHRTAVELYREGAARNDAAAKFKLGWCYEIGHGVDKDGLLCLKYCREAADGGSGEAMGTLGFLKLQGKILPTDYSGAYQLLKKAEKKGLFISKKILQHVTTKGLARIAIL